MHYIVFDLEFNQALPATKEAYAMPDRSGIGSEGPDDETKEPMELQPSKRMPFEILQFGAIKLDCNFQTKASFSKLVKPTLYTIVSPFITGLTGIKTEHLEEAAFFPDIYQDFIRFIGEGEAVFCVWGKNDVKELYRNADFHNLNQQLLPKKFLNIQPYASMHLGLPAKKLMRLQHTVESLNIPLTYDFHDAYHDAYYTAEILKKIYQPTMELHIYEHQTIVIRPRSLKKVIDFDRLILQFVKMYGREMTEEEQGIIKLAYRMGKTHQFLK